MSRFQFYMSRRGLAVQLAALQAARRHGVQGGAVLRAQRTHGAVDAGGAHQRAELVVPRPAPPAADGREAGEGVGAVQGKN